MTFCFRICTRRRVSAIRRGGESTGGTNESTAGRGGAGRSRRGAEASKIAPWRECTAVHVTRIHDDLPPLPSPPPAPSVIWGNYRHCRRREGYAHSFASPCREAFRSADGRITSRGGAACTDHVVAHDACAPRAPGPNLAEASASAPSLPRDRVDRDRRHVPHAHFASIAARSSCTPIGVPSIRSIKRTSEIRGRAGG